MTHNPYTEYKLNSDTFIRTFYCNVLQDELVWHRDKRNRIVEVLEGESWMIQFDEHLPKFLEPGEEFVIPAYTYHRIKRGTSDLTLKITEV